jgi:hypothetical protein
VADRGQTRVAFGRVNRRTDGQDTLDLRPFAEDMAELAASHRTETTVQGTRWIASDLEIRNGGDTMVGLLGFALQGQLLTFSEDDFSWLKAEAFTVTGAQPDTIVPFAVDLREHRRWVAVATSARIQHNAFAKGLAAVLNAAVLDLELMPTDWEVDMVTSRSDVLDWVAQHPAVNKFRRIVKFSNPGRDLDEDKANMRALGATVKDEEYRALNGKTLRLQGNEAFYSLLDGMERGDVEVELWSRQGGVRERYFSKKRPDETFIANFDNYQDGMTYVQEALLVYSSRQATEMGLD